MTEFHFFMKGDPSHPAVVCLHGLLGSCRNVMRLADAVANSGFHVLCYDQRGHGHSPHTGDYSLKSMASDVFAQMDRHGFEKAHLIGHSMGARVSLAASGRNPDRVASLTMLDAGTRVGPGASSNIRAIIESLPDEGFGSRSEAEQSLSMHSFGVKQFLFSNLRDRGGRLQWIFDLKGIRGQLISALTVDQSETWRALRMPALLVRAGNSDYFAQSEFEAMARENPAAETAVVPNAAHWVHVDNFVATTQAVLGFLERHK